MTVRSGSSWPTAVRRVVSGGQTGVDRGALDAAIDLGLEHGGYCPRGRRAEDGAVPARYRLTELPGRSYAKRTEANVVHSDGTLVIAVGRPGGGTALTIELARRHGRPLLTIDVDTLPAVAVCEVRDWLDRERIEILNVAGPRESGHPGIGERARRLIESILVG